MVQFVQALEIAESVVIPLGVMVAYSILGGIDDYQGFRLRPGEGMRARVKLSFQLVIALAAAVLLYWLVNDRHGWIAVPTVPVLLDIGLLYIPVAVIWGAPLIELMRRLRLGKNIRIDGPATHAAKMGTPAMGGRCV